MFIAVCEQDLEAWTQFFARFGIPATEERQPVDDIAGRLQVILEPREQITADVVDGRLVIPLEETVEFATEHYATFESALEMLDQMYEEVDTHTEYRRRGS